MKDKYSNATLYAMDSVNLEDVFYTEALGTTAIEFDQYMYYVLERRRKEAEDLGDDGYLTLSQKQKYDDFFANFDNGLDFMYYRWLNAKEEVTNIQKCISDIDIEVATTEDAKKEDEKYRDDLAKSDWEARSEISRDISAHNIKLGNLGRQKEEMANKLIASKKKIRVIDKKLSYINERQKEELDDITRR